MTYLKKTKDQKIEIESIKYFITSSKNNNDKYNKEREIILSALINREIPEHFFDNPEWKKLNNKLHEFIENELLKKHNINTYKNINCTIKAGRKYPYDFEIQIDNYPPLFIEFKFNATTITDCPQFSSPMYPSKFMIGPNFESTFYDESLCSIAQYANLNMPDKIEYLKSIHNNKVKCMVPFKELYDNNNQFNKFCKEVDKKAIKKQIEESDIKIEELSNYLLESQSKKEYMCYKDSEFYYDKIPEDWYKILGVIKRENTNFICNTKGGIKLEVKLRFKNGNGLQFPAFQISQKIPIVKELKLICKKNNIEPPKLKKDIIKKLIENNIIY
jgi:hypothetical protein